jgi:hypothetical protein
MTVWPLGFGESRRSGGYFRDTLFQDRQIREGLRSCHNPAFHKPRTPSMEPRYQRYPPGVWVWSGAHEPMPSDGSLDGLPSPFVFRSTSSPPLDSHLASHAREPTSGQVLPAQRPREVLYIYWPLSRSTKTVVKPPGVCPSLHQSLLFLRKRLVELVTTCPTYAAQRSERSRQVGPAAEHP